MLDIRENLINKAAEKRIKDKAPAPDNEKERLAEELVSLKSQLFQAQQHIFQLHAAAKAVVEGGQAGESTDSSDMPAWDSTHYFELTCTYLTRLGRDPREVHRVNPSLALHHGNSSKNKNQPSSDPSAPPDVVRDADGSDGLGGKWINGEYFIPHTVYLKLQRDKLSSDSILEASQKENERLMGVLKTQEKDLKTKEATFFDQQSELVKEINKLKNQLKSYSGAGVAEGSSGNPTEELLTGYQYSGIGGMAGRRGGDDQAAGGRKAFEAEAIIWRLQEQLAEAESRAAERENKLQQAIGRLTFDNEKLGRAAGKHGGGAAASTGVFVPKSEAHKLYFSGQLAGASAGWTDGEAPPPPPPLEDGSPATKRHSTRVGAKTVWSSGGEDSVPPQNLLVSELQVMLRDERQKHQEEVETLRSRLKWFADTQQAIETLSEERDHLADMVKQQGGASPGKKSRVGAGDSSFSSAGANRRHPSDIKKIKYVTVYFAVDFEYFLMFFFF